MKKKKKIKKKDLTSILISKNCVPPRKERLLFQ